LVYRNFNSERGSVATEISQGLVYVGPGDRRSLGDRASRGRLVRGAARPAAQRHAEPL